MDKLLKIGIVIGILIMSLFIFRISSVTFVDNHELGYKFNSISGEIDTLDRKGYFIYWPIVESVQTIELRPFQVCINANQRVLNCKLVRFNPNGFWEFIRLHGRDTYSVQTLNGSLSSGGNLYEIMKSYAYEDNCGSNNPEDYPFLEIIKEIKNTNADSIGGDIDAQ